MHHERSRRWLRRAGTAVALGVALSFLPTPAWAQVPVASVETVAVSLGTGSPAPGLPATASANGTAQGGVSGLEPFSMIAVSWTGPADRPPAVAVGHGGSYDEVVVEAEDLAPDAGTDTGRVAKPQDRHGNEPVWVDRADAVSVRAAAGTTDVEVHIVRVHQESRLVTNDEPTASSHSAGAAPFVHPRSEWGAAAPVDAPVIARNGVHFGVVHHTVGSNSYSPSQVPGMILGIQAFHQQSNGWSDIGYNFLVDAYGGIWEGRAGGIDKAVVGAHAGGFNTGSTGVALLGDFDKAAPSSAALDSLTTLLGWKMSIAGADPLGQVTVTVGTTDTQTQYPQGSTQVIPTIVGHRDLDVTACPGAYLYPQLANIRAATGAKYPNVFGYLDSVARAPGGITVNGWAIDRSTTAPIQVHAYVDGAFAGYSVASNQRDDVASAYPQAGGAHGFSFGVPMTGTGTHSLCLYGINDDGGVNYQIACMPVAISSNPFGNVDAYVAVPGGAQVQVWAVDPDTTGPVEIDVLVDGRLAAYATAGSARTDVAAAYPGYGAGHGTSVNVPLPAGSHSMCTYAINVAAGTNTVLACTGTGYNPTPLGHLDALVNVPGGVQAQVWALDPDTAAPIEIHALVDGRLAANATAGTIRTDVARLFPAWGPYHGTNLDIPVPAGTHTVCVYAINVGAGTNVALGCPVVSR